VEFASGVAITGTLAYVTNYSTTNVSVIDTTDNTVIDALDVGGDPQAVAIGKVPKLEHITPGSSWTMDVEGCCEVQTFQAAGTWTADDNGDSGTWTGGGKTLYVEFTAGEDNGDYLDTRYFAALRSIREHLSRKGRVT
jgi:YVTN family beta-propeller protein